MSNIKKRKELNIVKKVHHFIHANADEMSSLFKDASLMNAKIQKAMNKVSKACNIWASTDHPAITKKLSLRHMNEDFSSEIQADFLTARINDVNHEILNIFQAAIAYGERVLVPSIDAEKMMKKFENYGCVGTVNQGHSALTQSFLNPSLNSFSPTITLTSTHDPLHHHIITALSRDIVGCSNLCSVKSQTPYKQALFTCFTHD